MNFNYPYLHSDGRDVHEINFYVCRILFNFATVKKKAFVVVVVVVVLLCFDYVDSVYIKLRRKVTGCFDINHVNYALKSIFRIILIDIIHFSSFQLLKI